MQTPYDMCPAHVLATCLGTCEVHAIKNDHWVDVPLLEHWISNPMGPACAVELIERRLLLPRIEELALRMRGPRGWTSSVLVVGYLLHGLVFR